MKISQRIHAFSIPLAALTLAACGGSGSSDALPVGSNASAPAPQSCAIIDQSNYRIKSRVLLDEPCYLLKTGLLISEGGALSVSPGTRLIFESGEGIVIYDGGSLTAVGTEQSPITLLGAAPSPGFWSGLSVHSNSPYNRLEHVIIQDAGGSSATNAALFVDTGARLAANHLTLKNSETFGFSFHAQADLEQFDNVTSTGNGTSGFMPSNLLHKLTPGSTFSGNTNDYIVSDLRTTASLPIPDAVTWHNPGVPIEYESIFITGALTLSPGMVLRARSNGLFQVSSPRGSLTAIGTPDAPIIFTATDPSPGYWQGLSFSTRSTSNQLQHSIVEYGGDRFGSGNITVSPLGAASVTDSIIRHSRHWGMYVERYGELQHGGNAFEGNAAGTVRLPES